MAHSHFVVSNPRHTFATPLRYSSTDNAVVGTRCRYSSTTRSSVLLDNAVVGTPQQRGRRNASLSRNDRRSFRLRRSATPRCYLRRYLRNILQGISQEWNQALGSTDTTLHGPLNHRPCMPGRSAGFAEMTENRCGGVFQRPV